MVKTFLGFKTKQNKERKHKFNVQMYNKNQVFLWDSLKNENKSKSLSYLWEEKIHFCYVLISKNSKIMGKGGSGKRKKMNRDRHMPLFWEELKICSGALPRILSRSSMPVRGCGAARAQQSQGPPGHPSNVWEASVLHPVSSGCCVVLEDEFRLGVGQAFALPTVLASSQPYSCLKANIRPER